MQNSSTTPASRMAAACFSCRELKCMIGYFGRFDTDQNKVVNQFVEITLKHNMIGVASYSTSIGQHLFTTGNPDWHRNASATKYLKRANANYSPYHFNAYKSKEFMTYQDSKKISSGCSGAYFNYFSGSFGVSDGNCYDIIVTKTSSV